MRLVPGSFLGTSLRSRSACGLIFTEYRYEPLTNLRPHSHELAYFSFVLSGSYQEQCSSERERDCGPQTAIYHPAGERHQDRFGTAGGHIFSLEVPTAFITRAKDYELIVEERIAFKAASIRALGRRAYLMFLDSKPASGFILQATAMELLYLLPWKRQRGPESCVPQWLKNAIDILHAEFREPFSLALVADRVGTHPVHLARTFKHHHGMTMGSYVRRLRLSYAVEALDNKKTLAQIATEAGFSDQSHFGRVCKASTGMTPRQFRSKRLR